MAANSRARCRRSSAPVPRSSDELAPWPRRCAAHPDVYIDLGELRGYRYHTGVVFAAYNAGLGEALAQGRALR
jgi:ATP phosphoribosyltransferase regulatory subunit HisZ